MPYGRFGIIRIDAESVAVSGRKHKRKNARISGASGAPLNSFRLGVFQA